MVDVTIGGQVYSLPPYGLYELRAVAPQLDRIRAVANRLREIMMAALAHIPEDDVEARNAAANDVTLSEMLNCMGDLVEVVQIAVPGKSADDLLRACSYPEGVTLLREVYPAIMREAGMIPSGEPQPASTPPSSESPTPAP